MDLFRVFPWDGASLGAEPFGPLHVNRALQGTCRHGCPDRYGVLYCARRPISAIAEGLQVLRGHALGVADLRLERRRLALARLSFADPARVLDLDDPANLAARGLRPSRVATGHRPTTQEVAMRLFDEGVAGFFWGSSLEASWINASLFEARTRGSLRLAGSPAFLTLEAADLRQAAERLGVSIAD